MSTLWKMRLEAIKVWVIQPLLVLLILSFGVVGSVMIGSSASEPARSKDQARELSPLVEVRELTSGIEAVRIEGFGTVDARHRVDIVPQVGGRVVHVSPHLRTGGYFEVGDTLIQIERVDYELALSATRAEVTTRQRDLEIEQAEAHTARAEWMALHPDKKAPSLVVRIPQVDAATALLESAKAQFTSTELDLARTTVFAPFDGRVIRADIEEGEVIIANSPAGSSESIALVYDTSVFEIAVPIKPRDLRWLSLPSKFERSNGSQVTVLLPVDGQRLEIPGRVVRLGGVADSTTRMVDVIVEFVATDIPLGQRIMVVPGLFASVILHGPNLPEITRIDRALIRDRGAVWLENKGKLKVVIPEVVYAGPESILVSGLPPRSRLVVTPMEIVTDGMSIRVDNSQFTGGAP